MSDQLFDNPASTATADRRRSTREVRRAPGWLSEAAGTGARKAQQQVTVVDLSLHGVGMITRKPLEPEAAHWLVIATTSLHLSTRVRIVACREREDGTWSVGAEFF